MTDRPERLNKNYPVLVFIPGEDYKNADSMLYPAHLLAHKEVLVVTFNYRIGALGMLCWQFCELNSCCGLLLLKLTDFT